MAGSEKEAKRANKVVGEVQTTGQRTASEVAVCGLQHVYQVASARAEALSHAEVVLEDLAWSRGNMLGAVEEIRDDVACEWLETFVCVAPTLDLGWQGRIEECFRKVKSE